MEFLDANPVIRYLTRDDPVRAERSRQLLERVRRREIQLATSESVVAEIVFVLSSRVLYNQSRDNIRSLLRPILRLPGLKLPHRQTLLRALDIYAQSRLDFVDCICVAHMERLKVKTILSYDQDFDSVSGIERQEP